MGLRSCSTDRKRWRDLGKGGMSVCSGANVFPASFAARGDGFRDYALATETYADSWVLYGFFPSSDRQGPRQDAGASAASLRMEATC